MSEAGSHVRWSPDGSELFYIDGNRFYVVDVNTDPTFSHGKPRLLFDLEFHSTAGIAPFDVAPDGSRLIIVQRTSRADTTRHLNVVVDWSASLVD